VPPLCQGRIDWAEVRDQQGRNRKPRPVVILTPAQQVAPGQPFLGVAVTTRLDKPLPETHVRLPYYPKKRVKTRLTKPCAAVCNWLVEVREEDVLDRAGIVPRKELDRIIELVAQLGESETQSPPAN
jgi:hypothetical protein